jgi:predicted methyltransferase
MAMAKNDAAVWAAVRNANRPAADQTRDVARKPVKVLQFFAIEPGMTVLDMFSGGGYYTELLSYLVGDRGSVVAHNNSAYLAYAKDELDARYQDSRLANVKRLNQEANDLDFGDTRFDAALMILSYHDVYYLPGDGSWPKIDGPRMLKTIYDGLKPGAVLGVVDHAAKAGAPAEVGTSLHRIDPARLRSEFEAAGFIFDGEANDLRNPGDDLDKPMYAEGTRGKTDRFVFRFLKPGN